MKRPEAKHLARKCLLVQTSRELVTVNSGSVREGSSSAKNSSSESSAKLDANTGNFVPVTRIMKDALPGNAKIAKEAKECMQECVSEYILFITSEGMSTFLKFPQIRLPSCL